VLLGVSEEAKKMTLIFSVQCIIKQVLDSVFVISRIIEVLVRVISLRLRLITLTSASIILDIAKTSSNNIIVFIIHQTHYEKSDWSRAFNQFTIACELNMINAISAADIAFMMSSSMFAWLLSPLECSPQNQNG